MPPSTLPDLDRLRALVATVGAFYVRDRALERALDFLWAVRAHLHFARGRAEDRLVFDLQPEIAEASGIPIRTLSVAFLAGRLAGRARHAAEEAGELHPPHVGPIAV